MRRLPQYFKRLQKLLLRRGNTREDAEDLIQEAFLRMQEYCCQGGQVQKPEGFLVRTVLRLASNARRDSHGDLYASERSEELTLILDTQATPEEVFAADQCLNRMKAALDAVSPRTREIFFMHRLDGMSHSEIAKSLGMGLSTVEKHMARALDAVCDAMESSP